MFLYGLSYGNTGCTRESVLLHSNFFDSFFYSYVMTFKSIMNNSYIAEIYEFCKFLVYNISPKYTKVLLKFMIASKLTFKLPLKYVSKECSEKTL